MQVLVNGLDVWVLVADKIALLGLALAALALSKGLPGVLVTQALAGFLALSRSTLRDGGPILRGGRSGEPNAPSSKSLGNRYPKAPAIVDRLAEWQLYWNWHRHTQGLAATPLLIGFVISWRELGFDKAEAAFRHLGTYSNCVLPADKALASPNAVPQDPAYRGA